MHDLELTYIASGLILGGVIGIAIGIWIRLGNNRGWYLVPNYYVLLPKGLYYALPIGGLMTIAIAISLIMPKPELVEQVWLYGIFPLMVAFVAVIILQPKWFKPTWVRWLEENHGDILGLLIEEARQTPDWWDWARRVSTQEGLEAWVTEVRRKHGLEKNSRNAAA